MYNFGYLLRHNNNVQLLVVWIGGLVHWTINHFVLFSENSRFSGFSEIRQRHLNYYYYGVAKPDYEMSSWWDQFKITIHQGSVEIWWFCFWLAIFFTFFALREEIGRAITVARARTNAWVNLPDVIPPSVVSGPTGSGSAGTATTPRIRLPRQSQFFMQVFIFLREFVTALIAELLGERMMIRP